MCCSRCQQLPQIKSLTRLVWRKICNENDFSIIIDSIRIRVRRYSSFSLLALEKDRKNHFRMETSSVATMISLALGISREDEDD
mmetsp:Transcript_12261/g.14876  ORF Transcript_12261/g.14876 Transcript_12261/m.14876 type:complete len:84 (-) Transcript_12261:476-727(-)